MTTVLKLILNFIAVFRPRQWKKCRYSKTVTRTVHHANHSSISLNESSPRFPPEPPVRLQHYTSSDALTLQDLSGFIYFIPSILFIHSPVIAVKHSAHCYQFLDKIHFFLQPPSCLKPSSVAYWMSRSACSPNFLFVFIPGTCLFLHLRYTPLSGKKNKTIRRRTLRLFGPMW